MPGCALNRILITMSNDLAITIGRARLRFVKKESYVCRGMVNSLFGLSSPQTGGNGATVSFSPAPALGARQGKRRARSQFLLERFAGRGACASNDPGSVPTTGTG
jgi:hypothetical protein